MKEAMWIPIPNIRKDDQRVVLPTKTASAIKRSLGPPEVTERIWLKLELRRISDELEEAISPMKKRRRDELMKHWARAYPRLLILHGMYELSLVTRVKNELTLAHS